MKIRDVWLIDLDREKDIHRSLSWLFTQNIDEIHLKLCFIRIQYRFRSKDLSINEPLSPSFLSSLETSKPLMLKCFQRLINRNQNQSRKWNRETLLTINPWQELFQRCLRAFMCRILIIYSIRQFSEIRLSWTFWIRRRCLWVKGVRSRSKCKVWGRWLWRQIKGMRRKEKWSLRLTLDFWLESRKKR